MAKWLERIIIVLIALTSCPGLGYRELIEDRDPFSNNVKINYKSVLFNDVPHENSVTKNKFERLTDVFRSSITKLKQKHKKIDLVFLVDSSSSIGKKNFKSEIKFVKKVLADLTVSYNYTRVAIVTFSSAGKVVSEGEKGIF